MSPFWGDTICLFFSFESENPLIGRQDLVLQRRLFFLVFTYILDDKRVPPRNPAPGATILSDASGGLQVATSPPADAPQSTLFLLMLYRQTKTVNSKFKALIV